MNFNREVIVKVLVSLVHGQDSLNELSMPVVQFIVRRFLDKGHFDGMASDYCHFVSGIWQNNVFTVVNNSWHFELIEK